MVKVECFKTPEHIYFAKISLRATGLIGFSIGARNRFEIDDFDWCTIAIDREQHTIGIQLSRERTDDAFRIRHSPSNCYVRAKNVLDAWGIDYSSARSFALEWDLDTHRLVFDFEAPLPKTSKVKARHDS